MGTYFQLLEQDLELTISRNTRDLAENSLELVRLRRKQGAASGLDVRQAEQLLYTASAQIAAVERNIAQLENALSLLQGNVPSPQTRGRALEQIQVPNELPAGIPSSLLERRPDIRATEQSLIAANAQIGAAKALYFPQISLTAFAGGQSRSLLDIVTAPARIYSLAPAALMPIFRGGQIRSQVRFTEAQQRELLVQYQQTIFTAFREVSDALVEFDRTREQRNQQSQLVRALSETVQLSEARYKGGLDSYLQVLDAQRNLFAGELTLAQLQLRERTAVIQLYRALGGGWE
jgi:multidrug efflux system outer membrane protein